MKIPKRTGLFGGCNVIRTVIREELMKETRTQWWGISQKFTIAGRKFYHGEE